MTTQPPSFLQGAVTQPTAPAKNLADLRAKVAELRDATQVKADLEERLKTISARIERLRSIELPDLLDEAGVPSITLASEGNQPAVKIEVKPFYAANIAAGWTEEKRQDAFDYLSELGAGDLIKTEVSFRFGKDEHEEAMVFVEKTIEYDPIVKETVPHNTLSAWLKERYEVLHQSVDLEKIGGTVGRKAQLKEEN